MIFDLTRNGIAVPAGALTAQEFTRLKRRLTVTSMGFGDRLMTMQTWRIDQKARIMYLPRIRGIIELDKLGHSVRLNYPEGDKLSADVSGIALKLSDFQVPIVEFLMKTPYADSSRALGLSSAYLDLQPGKGKTYIIMALIRHFARKTLVIVPGKELITQTVATMEAMFPMLTIGQYWGSKKTDGDIVVMTTKSAALSNEYTFTIGKKKVTMPAAEYFARFGFTAMDEIHTYCTREQQAIFHRAGSIYTFGCSGTSSDREDKMDAVSHMHVGIPISGAQLMQPVLSRLAAQAEPPPEWKFRAYCLNYNGPPEFTETLTSTLGTVSCAMMVSQFSKDPWRSQWLVDVIKQCVADGHQVFVMLDRTELCKLAWDYLLTAFTEDELALTPGAQAASMVTGKVRDKLRAVARNSRVVVGTYACIGTGVSWDEFSALVCFHPRKNKFKQFLNRIFREGGDRSRERVAYYLKDNATSIKSQYSGFRKICKEERSVDPKVLTCSWRDIDVSDEVKKISDDFIIWDREQQAARLAKSGKKDQDAESDSSIGESDNEGLD